jgi:hypothetical protein
LKRALLATLASSGVRAVEKMCGAQMRLKQIKEMSQLCNQIMWKRCVGLR